MQVVPMLLDTFISYKRGKQLELLVFTTRLVECNETVTKWIGAEVNFKLVTPVNWL